jgi:phosphate starvation-inducible protein PhoH
MTEKIILTDTMEQTANIFGNFDMNAAMIEKTFAVSITNRESQTTAGDAIDVRGEDGEGVRCAFDVLEYLKGVAARGNEITEQTVNTSSAP